MQPYIAILAALLAILSVALQQAQNHGTQTSTLTIASGPSIGPSEASPLSRPQANVLAASAVRSKACRLNKTSHDSSDRAVNQPVWKLSKRALRTPANYHGNPAEFMLAEYDKSFQLRYHQQESMGEFLKLGNQRFNAAIGGLRGCTALIVVSRAGVWLAHFYEIPTFRDDQDSDGGWNVEMDEPGPRTETNRARFMEKVLLPMQHGGPHFAGLSQYINLGGPFHRSQRVEYSIITPRLYGGNPGIYQYEPEVREISAAMNNLFPGAHSAVIDYMSKDDLETPVAGKLLFQYDPWAAGPCSFGQVAQYKVWFEDGHNPILSDQWRARAQQIVERPEDYRSLYARASPNACGSSTPAPPPKPQQTAFEIL